MGSDGGKSSVVSSRDLISFFKKRLPERQGTLRMRCTAPAPLPAFQRTPPNGSNVPPCHGGAASLLLTSPVPLPRHQPLSALACNVLSVAGNIWPRTAVWEKIDIWQSLDHGPLTQNIQRHLLRLYSSTRVIPGPRPPFSRGKIKGALNENHPSGFHTV